MGDFLAEALVLVQPDTRLFRAQLQAQLTAATKGLVVPIPVAAAAATGAQRQVAASLAQQATATQILGVEQERAARRTVELTRTQLQLQKGVIASTASLTGLRGAVLAASTPFLLATIAVTAFGKAIQESAAFESQLNVFRVTAAATAEEMENVRQEAVALGKDITLPSVSARDAAEAFTELAKAGLTVEDSLAGARGVLQLATAAQISNAEATLLTANALNAFSLSGEQAVRVADLFATGANESQASITDMGIALRQSAAVAAQLGVSLDDTVAFLTQLARAGISGSDAGTALRVAFTRLIAPTEDAAKQLERFQINLRNAQGDLRPEVFADLGRAMENLGKQEQARILFEIFGQDAQRVAAILATQGLPALRETQAALEQQGSAAELAAARTEGFSGAVDQLGSSLSTLGTRLRPATNFLGALFRGASAAVGGVDAALGALSRVNQALEGSSKTFTDALRRTQASGFFQGFPEQAQNILLLGAAFEEVGSILVEQPKLISDIVEQLGRLPTQDEIIRITADPSQARVELKKIIEEARDSGTLSAEALQLAFERESQAGVGKMTEPLKRGLGDFVQDAARVGKEAAEALVKSFNASQIQGQLQAQQTAVAKAQAFGETGLEELIAERERIDRILESARAPTGPALEQLLNERRSVISQIEAIGEEEARTKKEAADKIKKARREADEALLDALSGRRQQAENAVAIAAQTKGVEDDIRAQETLHTRILRQIAKIRKQVNDEELKRDAIRTLIKAKISTETALKELEQQQRQELRDRARERRERIAESFDLDVQIAAATGNTQKEIAAREKQIANTEKLLRQFPEGSNQRKRLILQLRQEQKELRDLRNEKKKSSDEFAKLTFEFLQTQQGFAANLLGNLIPQGAAGGLVGNITPPPPVSTGAGVGVVTSVTSGSFGVSDVGAAIGATAGVAEARDRGPTRGDASTTNHLLREILGTLQGILTGTGHPEARFQRRQAGGALDTM